MFDQVDESGTRICERWRYELLGRTTIVLCDNNAVVQLLANGTTSKAARVRNTIADMIGFDFVMLHIPTHENLVADALSRDPRFGAAFADAARALSTTRATTEADELRVQSMAISLPVAPIVDIHSPSSATPPPPATAGIGAALDYLAPPFSDTRAALINLVEHQQRDPALATLRRVANNESLPTNPRPSPSIRRQWRRATQLKPFFDAAHAGALFVVPPGANYRRLVVPDGQRDNVIAEIHGPAHINAVATAKVAATLFWWPAMDAQIKNTIRGCAACQRVNAPRTRTPGNLGDVERDRVPIRLTEWEIDTFHVGHELGSGLAISVVERFSGFVMSKVVPSSSASDAIAAFTDLVLRPFGVPRRIFSDNGSEFLGAFAQELRRLGIEHIVGPSRQPPRRRPCRAAQSRPQQSARAHVPPQRTAPARVERRTAALARHRRHGRQLDSDLVRLLATRTALCAASHRLGRRARSGRHAPRHRRHRH
jgi:hypothetical protein